MLASAETRAAAEQAGLPVIGLRRQPGSRGPHRVRDPGRARSAQACNRYRGRMSAMSRARRAAGELAPRVGQRLIVAACRHSGLGPVGGPGAARRGGRRIARRPRRRAGRGTRLGDAGRGGEPVGRAFGRRAPGDPAGGAAVLVPYCASVRATTATRCLGRETRQFHRVTPARVNGILLVPGGDHGVDLLSNATGQRVRTVILAFLKVNAACGPAQVHLTPATCWSTTDGSRADGVARPRPSFSDKREPEWRYGGQSSGLE
jgi:hypothetical protein